MPKSRDRGFRPWAEEMLSKAEEMAGDDFDEEAQPRLGPEMTKAIEASLQALEVGAGTWAAIALSKRNPRNAPSGNAQNPL